MKLLLLIYSGSTPEKISALLDRDGASGHTQLAHARGSGTTGRVEGTRAWPGESTVFFSVVPNERVDTLRSAVRAYRATAGDSERLHIATLPLEDFE